MSDRELMIRDAAYKQLSVCQEISPTGKEQAGFARLYNKMLMAGESYTSVIRALANALADGLEYGNWPEVAV